MLREYENSASEGKGKSRNFPASAKKAPSERPGGGFFHLEIPKPLVGAPVSAGLADQVEGHGIGGPRDRPEAGAEEHRGEIRPNGSNPTQPPGDIDRLVGVSRGSHLGEESIEGIAVQDRQAK